MDYVELRRIVKRQRAKSVKTFRYELMTAYRYLKMKKS